MHIHTLIHAQQMGSYEAKWQLSLQNSAHNNSVQLVAGQGIHTSEIRQLFTFDLRCGCLCPLPRPITAFTAPHKNSGCCNMQALIMLFHHRQRALRRADSSSSVADSPKQTTALVMKSTPCKYAER